MEAAEGRHEPPPQCQRATERERAGTVEEEYNAQVLAEAFSRVAKSRSLS